MIAPLESDAIECRRGKPVTREVNDQLCEIACRVLDLPCDCHVMAALRDAYQLGLAEAEARVTELERQLRFAQDKWAFWQKDAMQASGQLVAVRVCADNGHYPVFCCGRTKCNRCGVFL